MRSLCRVYGCLVSDQRVGAEIDTQFGVAPEKSFGDAAALSHEVAAVLFHLLFLSGVVAYDNQPYGRLLSYRVVIPVVDHRVFEGVLGSVGF